MAEFSGDPTNKNTFDTLESNNPGTSRQAEEETSPSKKAREEETSPSKKAEEEKPSARKQQRIKDFFDDFNRRIRQENISYDNIYSMASTSFKWQLAWKNKPFKPKQEIHVNLNKLLNDELTIILCTNASGSDKLPLYFIHKYESEETVQYLNNQHLAKILKSERDFENELNIFKSWYEDFFIKHVSEHQQKAGKSDKVILLSDCEKFLSSEYVERDPFEVEPFPPKRKDQLQPIDENININLKNRFYHAVGNYPTFGLESICKRWTDMSSKDFSWNKIIKAKPRSVDPSSTSFVNQPLKPNKNVREEDTAVEKSSEPIKKKPRRE